MAGLIDKELEERKRTYAKKIFEELWPNYEEKLYHIKDGIVGFFEESYIDGFGPNYWATGGYGLVQSFLQGYVDRLPEPESYNRDDPNSYYYHGEG